MKRINLLLLLLAVGWSVTHAAELSTNSAAANRPLIIDPSSMWLGGGKATLTIGLLRRMDGVYTGDYKIKVFPYFFKNDKGRLAIIASDESMAEINVRKVTQINATATSGKDGLCRPIAVTVTPADINHGTLKLWFTVGDRKMIFEPAYHYATNAASVILAQTTTNMMPPRFLVVIQKP